MEQVLAYVCCPETDSGARLQKHCRKIYDLGYVPICPRFGFLPFLDEGSAEDIQGMSRMSQILLRRCRMVVVCGTEVKSVLSWCGNSPGRNPCGKPLSS